MKAHISAAGLLAGLSLAGCALGPDYQRPEVPTPKAWQDAPQSRRAPPEAWWRAFRDPTLDRLIQEALTANLDLKIAVQRIRDVRSQRDAALAAGLPSLDGRNTVSRRLNNFSSGGGGGANGAGGGFPIGGGGTGDNLINILQAGVDAQWEIDLFGGIRRAVEAGDATIEAEEEFRRDVAVGLLAEVARNYVQYRLNRHLHAIGESEVRNRGETLELMRVRQQAGLASELEVAQEQTARATAEAQLPGYVAAERLAQHALENLLGRNPGSLQAVLGGSGQIPNAVDPVSADLPSELLRRRPDIRRAERQLAAATAQIGVATAALFPKLNLSAFLGIQNLNIKDFTPVGKSWSMASSLTLPIFNWGRLRADLESREAQQEQSVLTYRKTVINAFKEVEDALVNYAQERQRQSPLQQAVDAANLAVQLAEERHRRGLTAFSDVLIAQQALFESQRGQLQSQAQLAGNVIGVYKALGGGWENVSESATTP